MPPAYQSSDQAKTGLTAAFTPSGGSLTPAQQQAINNAASLVPTVTPPQQPASTTTPPTQTPPQVPQTQQQTQPTDPNQDALKATQDQKVQADAAYQQAATQVQTTISNIQNGATPLTAGEQAQIDGLKGQFDTLINQQKLTNTGASGTANIRGYQTGAAEYDANFQVKTIGAIVSAGQAKVADLQVKEASAIADLTQSFKNNDIKAVQASWDIYQKAYDERQQALKDTIKDTQDAIKAAQDKQAAAQKTYYEQVQKPLQDLVQTAAKYGATPDVIAKINNAPSVEAGLNIASAYLRDPKAQYEIESVRLENALKQTQIANAPLDTAIKKATLAKTLKETEQIGAPSAADIKQQKADAESAKQTIPVLQDRIAQIDGLVNSPGLAGSVGPNPLARSAMDFNAFTGVRQNFIAGVNQLTNQETLAQLLSLKAQGGTLGALSDSEGDLLRQAASKIGTWQIKDKNGNVTGYNTTDAAMQEELNTIKNITQRALDRAQGVVLPTEDQSALDSYFGNSSASSTSDLQGFQPANYY